MDAGAVNFVTQGAAKLVIHSQGRSACLNTAGAAGTPLSLR